MLHNAERSAAYFCIPAAQVVEIAIEIEIWGSTVVAATRSLPSHRSV